MIFQPTKMFAGILAVLLMTGVTLAAEPTATILSPVAGSAIVADSTVTISGTVTGSAFSKYELAWLTANNTTWQTTGISIPNNTTLTINGILGTWNTASLNLTAWTLRLKASSTDGYQKLFYVSSTSDNVAPQLSAVMVTNLSTSSNLWVKNGDGIQISAIVSDNSALLTENIVADLTALGGSRYAAPTQWTLGSSGPAVWQITANITSNGQLAATVSIQDFGNNWGSSMVGVTADTTFPKVILYNGTQRLFTGDYVSSNINLFGSVSDNFGITAFALYAYDGATLLGMVSNTSGATLNIPLSALNSRALQLIGAAKDFAGNVTTLNLTKLSATTGFAFSELLCAPNPFNPNQTVSHIGYKVSQAATVKLSIFSITGERVYSSVQTAETSDNGYNEFTWNGVGVYGQQVPNGLYLVVMTADSASGETKKAVTKMAVLK
jgi:hypothetical protein